MFAGGKTEFEQEMDDELNDRMSKYSIYSFVREGMILSLTKFERNLSNKNECFQNVCRSVPINETLNHHFII